MSAETFTTAMFLITAVIAAGVLVNAVFPVVYNMAGTFSSASHESDQRMRTDFKIIAYQASGTTGQVWIKNIGSTNIHAADIVRSDVLTGPEGNFDSFSYYSGSEEYPPVGGQWTYAMGATESANNYWDPGETMKISFTFANGKVPTPDSIVFFQFVLPDGIWRSINFHAS
jgi:archaeal flagellar protein FlaG